VTAIEPGAVAAVAASAGAAASPRSERLASRLAKGAAVEVAGFGAGQILRLAANLVLTRILFPEAFGLLAMLSLVLYGLMMLTDVGLGSAVIRSPRGEDPLFLDTVWSIKVVRGLSLWVAASVIAWPASILFRERALLLMLVVGSASPFIQGFCSMRWMVLRRHLRPVPLVVLDLSTQIIGLTASISLVWAGLGVWALVVGTLVGTAAHTVLSFALPGTHRERFRMDPDARREVMHFGRWIFASSAVTFAAGRGDQLVLGRLLGAASLGVYNIALALAELPDALVGRVIDGMLYPAYSRVHNERKWDLPRVYYRSRLALDALAHTALGGLIALSPWIIHLLYDRRYQDASSMLQIIALRTSLTVLASPCESALFAHGLSMYNFRRNLAVAVCTLVAMPIGHALGGTNGLLWGTTVARAAALPILWPAARKLGLLKFHRELLFIPLLACGYLLGRALLWILLHL
jgi:O-antigen/teichoic acid export membrane protein